MDDRLCKMETKINSINENVNQVVAAILGNPLTKQGGFIEEIRLLKEEIDLLKENAANKAELALLKDRTDKQEEFRKRFTWTISIIVAAALVIQWIVNMVLNFLEK